MQAPTQQQATSPRPYLWAIRLLALVAVGIAGYLLTKNSGGAVAGCDSLSGFNCSEALASRWSEWLGVPVSLVGVLCYGVLAVGSWLIGRRSGKLDAAGWLLLELFTPVVFGAAVWFIGLQVTGSSPSCVYCLGVHVCGVLIAALAILERRSATLRAGPTATAPLAPVSLAPGPGLRSENIGPLPPPKLGAATLGGMVMVVALVLGQVFNEPTMEEVDLAGIEGDLTLGFDSTSNVSLPNQQLPDQELPNDQPPADQANAPAVAAEESTSAQFNTKRRQDPKYRRRANGSRVVKLLGGRLPLDTYKVPLLGSPEADYVVVEMMDYSCPHCRKFRPMIDEARDRYGDRLAVAVLPIPGEFLCNKYLDKARPKSRGACKLARLALAVADVAPEEFARVHEYLLNGEEMPSFTEALIFARETVDPDDLSIALKSDEIEQRLEAFIELYGTLSKARGKGLALPSQILGDSLVQGSPATVDDLCQAWEEYLGAKPVAEAEDSSTAGPANAGG